MIRSNTEVCQPVHVFGERHRDCHDRDYFVHLFHQHVFQVEVECSLHLFSVPAVVWLAEAGSAEVGTFRKVRVPQEEAEEC